MGIKISGVYSWMWEYGNHVIWPSNIWRFIYINYGYFLDFNCQQRDFLIMKGEDNGDIFDVSSNISGDSILWVIYSLYKIVARDFASGANLVVIGCVSFLDSDNVNFLVNKKFPNIFALTATYTLDIYLAYSDCWADCQLALRRAIGFLFLHVWHCNVFTRRSKGQSGGSLLLLI